MKAVFSRFVFFRRGRRGLSAISAGAASAVLIVALSAAFAAPLQAARAAESLWEESSLADFSCEDIAAAFQEYQTDIDLTYTAIANSLTNFSLLLEEISKKPQAQQTAALQEAAEYAQSAVYALHADHDTVALKGIDIQDVLDECFKR